MSSRLEDPRVLPLSYDKYRKRMETGAGDTVCCNAPCKVIELAWKGNATRGIKPNEACTFGSLSLWWRLVTVDVFFNMLIEALDNDKDVFKYQSDLFWQNGECGRIQKYTYL